MREENNIDFKALFFKHRNKIINIAALVLALYFAFKIYNAQEGRTRMLMEQRQIEIKKNEVLEEIGQLQKKFAEYKKSINNKDVSSVINILNNIARNSSTDIISVRPLQQEGDFSFYNQYFFDLKVKAKDYHTLGRFMSNLEGDPSILNVDIAKIAPETRPERGGQFSELIAELKISTILMK